MEPAERVGAIFAGKYRLERLLGVGGMGAVYEAVHVGVEKRFAIKLVKTDSGRTPDSVQRFTQEARAAALIGHPNLVEVFDLGETDDGTLYMVMELLAGRSLHDALRSGPLPIERATEIAIEVLRALDAAHRAGFVHRDIKPANLFLAERSDGKVSVKVLDFGIAKLVRPDMPSLTQSGVVVGTPLYMAPEQVLAEREVDGRADVWSVGATLFEMLTGRPVHLAQTATAAAVKVVTEPAPRVHTLRAEVDAGLDAVVARALAVSKGGRFASAAEMLAALEACRSSVAPTLVDSGVAPSVANIVRAELAARSRYARLVVLGVASLGLGALVGIVIVSRAARREPGTVAVSPAIPIPSTAPSISTPTPTPTPTSTPTSTSTSASASTSTSTHPHPSCPLGEHISSSHCCSLGLEWQQDHCDRPLAKEVPF
jgi:serine/threonine protein kinase